MTPEEIEMDYKKAFILLKKIESEIVLTGFDRENRPVYVVKQSASDLLSQIVNLFQFSKHETD